MNKILMKRFFIGSILAVAVMLATTSTAQAQEKNSKGGATLLLKPMKTAQDIDTLKSGDAVVSPVQNARPLL